MVSYISAKKHSAEPLTTNGYGSDGGIPLLPLSDRSHIRVTLIWLLPAALVLRPAFNSTRLTFSTTLKTDSYDLPVATIHRIHELCSKIE